MNLNRADKQDTSKFMIDRKTQEYNRLYVNSNEGQDQIVVD
jgi:hypothetical protein